MKLGKPIRLLLAVVLITLTVTLFYRGIVVSFSKQLVVAIKNDDINAVEKIIDKCPACVNYYPGFAPLFVYSLLEAPISYPLIYAIWVDDPTIIRSLVDTGADPNCVMDGKCPLWYVYRSKNEHWYDISCYLIDNDADVNYVFSYDRDYRETGCISILDDIISWTDSPVDDEELMNAFEYALDHCDHSRVDWSRTLWFAARDGRIEIVRMLLDDGYCDVNGEYDDVGTALIAAVQAKEYYGFCNKEMIEILLDYGADKYLKDEEGLTAYDYAVLCCNRDAIELLGD
jgi:ankyrin repeat protein